MRYKFWIQQNDRNQKEKITQNCHAKMKQLQTRNNLYNYNFQQNKIKKKKIAFLF